MRNSVDIIQIGSLYGRGRDVAGRVYDTGGLSPVIRTPSGGNDMPCVIVGDYEKSHVTQICGQYMWAIDEPMIIQVGNLTTHDGTNPQAQRVYMSDGIAATLSACGKAGGNAHLIL